MYIHSHTTPKHTILNIYTPHNAIYKHYQPHQRMTFLHRDGELGATPDTTITRRDEERDDQQPTMDDTRRDGTRRDEELTPTEPHKCAYIHWERSQANREMGT